MTDLELLAPARNVDIGIAAIDCGADAVYIAGPAFGARQAAGNNIEDIRRLCSYAHKFGARIFIAFNTIVFENELDTAYRMMDELASAGADALIIQDLGLTDTARRLAGVRPRQSSIPLHASTQCAIRTPERARFLESAGFSRLILERELSAEQIRKIREAVSCELEFFVHGALCVCYSGQCYISERMAGRSANRGECIQACRSRYNLTDENGKILSRGKTLLSLKDLNLMDRIFELADCGVSSFKIEGRLKNISYVRNIVRSYSSALDRIVKENPGRFRRASRGKIYGGFDPVADKTFNRGYTELFIDGKRGMWANPESAKAIGEEIGKVIGINKEKTGISVELKKGVVLNNGDGFCFITGRGETVGFRGDVCSGNTVRTRPVSEIFKGAILYRNIDQQFEKSVGKNLPERLIDVDVTIECQKVGEEYSLLATAVTEDGRRQCVTLAGLRDRAMDPERMKSVIISQISKSTGIYSFSGAMDKAEDIPFVRTSAINGIRRKLAEALDSEDCIGRPLYVNDSFDGPLEYVNAPAASYKENIANSVAGKLYESAGFAKQEPAYEISQIPDAELMKTKYCLRYQMGWCPVQGASTVPRKLYLENNGRKFALHFDCKACEMTVKEA